MNEASNLRDRLLSAVQVDPSLKRRYEMELQAILRRQLSPGERWYSAAAGFLNFLLAVGLGIAAVGMTELDDVIRVILGVATVHCAAQGVRIGLIVYRGHLDRRHSPTQKLTMRSVYLTVVIVLFLVYAMRAGQTGVNASALPMMFMGILLGVLLLIAGWIHHWITLAALKTREDLLEVKLQLAATAGKQDPT